MAFWNRARASVSLDEFVGEGEERCASPLEISVKSKDWQKRLGAMTRGPVPPSIRDVSLPAFSLIRGGDLFERPKAKITHTEPELVSMYAERQLVLRDNKVAREERDAAMTGVLMVLSGNPALCKRMLLAKPIDVIIVPKGRDFRELGFPPNTNPHSAGIFWNSAKTEHALLGLREEHILEKPWLMVHEMTHAVHFLALTKSERDDIDQLLIPVYRSRRWVEEAVAIYAERAFGAQYEQDDLEAPGLYGKTRRDWNERHVFAQFIDQLMRPPPRKK